MKIATIAAFFLFFFMFIGIHNLDLAFNLSESPGCFDTDGSIERSSLDLHVLGMSQVTAAIAGLMILYILRSRD